MENEEVPPVEFNTLKQYELDAHPLVVTVSGERPRVSPTK
jgi:hypothetical protein